MRPIQRLLPSTVLLLPCLAAACGAEPGTRPGAGAADQNIQALRAAPTPLAVVALASPRPVVTTDGKQHLLYELVLQNVGAASLELASIEVLGDDGRAPLVRYQGDGLAAVVLVVGDDGTGVLAPGGEAVAFVDLGLPATERPPRRLTNRLATVEIGGGGRGVSTLTIAVADERPALIGPPLRGEQLLDLNGCCASDHTRALLSFPDGLFVAQRYAIDSVRVDVAAALAGGNPFAHGDPTRNESYLTFGAEVLAVTDGQIVEVRDGMAENVPNVLPPPDVATAAGNYVIEALADGRFALYAHVQPGSLRVRPGDRVRRGDVLALVGNTGNSSMPHLHFHVMDRPSPLDSNGLPYVFDRFQLEATVDLNADDPQPIFVEGPRSRRALLPMNGDLLAFP
jgi:hypothetical protein